MQSKEGNVIQRSIGWSTISELSVKLITPIANMILARLLLPEAFGIVAICNMVVSFADIVTDAGFGKYLVQADFVDDDECKEFANVAFWSNFLLSFAIVFIIIEFRKPIAVLLGGIQYANVIAVACVQLLCTSISSIQTGLFRRKFEFKKLFFARVVLTLVPLCFTVPIAFLYRSHWALVVGNLIGSAVNSIVLSVMSSWKPRLYFSSDQFIRMFSFSFWSLCEGLANWVIFWFDTFLVARYYSSYYVGIYKNSSSMVLSVMGIVTASVSPVLFSALSRVKDDNQELCRLYQSFQQLVLFAVVPLGVTLFSYRDSLTLLFFGSGWKEGSMVIGLWGLMMVFSVGFYSLPAELFKASGIPRVLFLFQCSYLAFLVPTCLYAVKIDFWLFVYVRCGGVLIQIILSVVFTSHYYQLSAAESLKNIILPTVCSIPILCTAICSELLNCYFIGQIICMAIGVLLYAFAVFAIAKRIVESNFLELKSVRLS